MADDATAATGRATVAELVTTDPVLRNFPVDDLRALFEDNCNRLANDPIRGCAHVLRQIAEAGGKPAASEPRRGRYDSPMRSIDAAQRRARLAVRHRLAMPERTGRVAEIARSMVALHATDPATVYLSVAARADGLTPSDVEQALYEDRSLLRMLAMRRTMFVVPVESVPILQASCADALAHKQRRTYGKYLTQAGIGDGDTAGWWAEVEAETHKALLARGAAT
uniref:DNA glycosylase AlkZ-like family protein n=1 Tax=Nocardia exalbida TaxID=290231 RepID=UPI001FE13C3A